MNILDIVLSVLPYVLGIGVVGALVGALLNFLKEVSDVLVSVVDALKDNQLNKEEVANIAQQAKEVVDAARKFKDIFKK